MDPTDLLNLGWRLLARRLRDVAVLTFAILLTIHAPMAERLLTWVVNYKTHQIVQELDRAIEQAQARQAQVQKGAGAEP